MYVRYWVLVPVTLIMRIINFPTAPIVVLFASEDGWLPKWLWAWQTPDNSLNGDNGWINEHRPFKQERNKFERWVNRWRWLWRNSFYGFAFDVKGFTVEYCWDYSVKGDEAVSNRPLHEGLVRRYFVNGDGDGKRYFQFYYVKKWTPKRCIRINLGWKLWGEITEGRKIQYVFSISPFNSWSTGV
jgi:hypothetical protein